MEKSFNKKNFFTFLVLTTFLSLACAIPKEPLINLLDKALDCTKSGEIELHFVAKNLKLDTGVEYSSRLYNGEFPGPLIIMRAGEICSITLYNDMKSEPCSTEQINGFMCPDSTVLHTHGLHVSPVDDNILQIIPSGSSEKYTFHLKDDLMMGTFWYHSHQHGAVSLQVNGGAFGMLLLEPSSRFKLPDDLSSLYDKEENNHLVVFSIVDLRDPSSNLGEQFFHNYLTIANSYSPNSVTPSSTVDTPYDYYVAVNGQYAPSINATAGKAFLIRSVFASGTDLLFLQFISSNKCKMRILARDGVFHSEDVKYNDVETLIFFQGTRTDVAILCDEPGEYILGVVSSNNGLYSNYNQNEVLYINVDRSSSNIPLPSSYIPIHQFPEYLQDLTLKYNSIEVSQVIGFHGGLNINSLNNTTVTSDFGIQISENSNDPYYIWGGIQNLTFINNNKNGEGWCVNEVYKIRTFGDHPFHQHINHFQVLNTSLNNSEMLRNKEWRDVVLGTLDGDDFLTRTSDFDGFYAVHCHIFEHADFGMTSALNISYCGDDSYSSFETSFYSLSSINSPSLFNQFLPVYFALFIVYFIYF